MNAVLDQQTADAVRKWKDFRYRVTDLPFASAVRSVLRRDPVIDIRQSETRKSDWVVRICYCYLQRVLT